MFHTCKRDIFKIEKNLLKIGGKELFVRAIEAAKNSKCFKKIIVSSEDKTILKIAENYGALPVLREKLSKKDIRAKDVLKNFLKKDNTIYDNITYAYAHVSFKKF